MRYMDEVKREAVEFALACWRDRAAQVTDGRDGLVRLAAEAGIGKKRIHELTGIARTTIDRILGETEDQGHD